MADFQPGDVFAGHRIEGLAGRGGMGVVYRATQLALDRVVALKVIAPALASDAEFRRRFVGESKAAASIEHPNVIPIYYAGEREGILFIAMRYVPGDDLRTIIRAAGHLDEGRAARIVDQVGAALDAAHARGLVHRDVKPANVLLDQGDHAYLTDFGLTKRMHSATGVSRAGGWVGTLGYVAPEQIRSGPVDARADVYALGCVLVHSLTGRPPYLRDTEEATLWAHLNEPPPASSEGVPEAFEPVVARALAKDPDERYQSAGDLGRAALAAAGSKVPSAPERTVARGAAAPAEGSVTRLSGEPGATAPTALAPVDPELQTRWAEYGEAVTEGQWGDDDGGKRATGGRARRLAPLLAGLALVAVAAVVATVIASGGDEPEPGKTGTTAPQRDAGGGGATGGQLAVTERTSTRPIQQPSNIAVAGGSVWVTTFNSEALGRVDAESGRRRQAQRGIPTGTTDIASSGDRLYVVSAQANTLTQVDARTGNVVKRTELPPGAPYAVDVDRSAIWVGSRASRLRNPLAQIIRVDRRDGTIKSFGLRRGVKDLAVTRDAVWVTNETGSTVTRLDKVNAGQGYIKVGDAPTGIAAGGGYLYVANQQSGTVTRIDAKTKRRASRSVGPLPQLVAYGGGAVWVTVGGASQVMRLDGKSLQPTGTVSTALNPFGIAYADGGVWVASNGEDVVQRVVPRNGGAPAGGG